MGVGTRQPGANPWFGGDSPLLGRVRCGLQSFLLGLRSACSEWWGTSAFLPRNLGATCQSLGPWRVLLQHLAHFRPFQDRGWGGALGGQGLSQSWKSLSELKTLQAKRHSQSFCREGEGTEGRQRVGLVLRMSISPRLEITILKTCLQKAQERPQSPCGKAAPQIETCVDLTPL